MDGAVFRRQSPQRSSAGITMPRPNAPSRRRPITLSAPQPTPPAPKKSRAKDNLSDKLRFSRLSDNAVAPERVSKHSAGYGLSSAYDYDVPPGGKFIVLTDLEIQVPRATYGRIAALPALTVSHNIDVGHGIIESDSRGNVGVLVLNRNSSESVKIERGARVAQLIVERIAHPKLVEVADFDQPSALDAAVSSPKKQNHGAERVTKRLPPPPPKGIQGRKPPLKLSVEPLSQPDVIGGRGRVSHEEGRQEEEEEEDDEEEEEREYEEDDDTSALNLESEFSDSQQAF